MDELKLFFTDRAEFLAKIANAELPESSAGWDVTITPRKSKMTTKQRSSIHVWFREQAEAWNAIGFDQTQWLELVKEGPLEFAWSEHTVKENVYKPILLVMTGKDSTEQMNTTEPSEILNPLAKRLGEINIPILDFPKNR